MQLLFTGEEAYSGGMILIVYTVPKSHADEVRIAAGRAGGGKIGCYDYCSFSVAGFGRFRPQKGSHPSIGQEGVLEVVEEERVELLCEPERLEEVIDAIRKAHPYEEPYIYTLPVIRR